MEPRYYLWTDNETTGLNRDTDSILEVAMFVTDARLEILPDTAIEEVFYFPPNEYDALDPVVLKMHTDNGLLAESRKVWEAAGSIEDRINKRLGGILGRLGINAFDALAGSSVHFDRGFLERCPHLRLPTLVKHRNVDVSSFQLALGGVRPGLVPPKEESNHRAMPDLFRSLRAMRTMMRNIGVLP